MITIKIKNMLSSDMDFYSCYVKQHNANISGKTLYLPLIKADTTHSLTPSPVTMYTADTTHSLTPSPVTTFTADTTHSLTPSPVTTFTGSTTIHTDATSQGFSSADTTQSLPMSPVTKFTDTIYIITSVASIGLVIVGVIAFFVIRNYRNKRGFYDVQKFHQIHLCRLN
ncbi:hypothetical protein Bpfe_003048 [Biomphalaria pfeifferi]|uniref:Uncharacterized protein n=1 Tax=Biomphalaria pfeifferi TaxID=112525 RepID=A0AAD8C6U5_BIOPF|nr:hypothetical protein Bpfe_003048 [Biomphalaria pfeifferi]